LLNPLSSTNCAIAKRVLLADVPLEPHPESNARAITVMLAAGRYLDMSSLPLYRPVDVSA